MLGPSVPTRLRRLLAKERRVWLRRVTRHAFLAALLLLLVYALLLYFLFFVVVFRLGPAASPVAFATLARNGSFVVTADPAGLRRVQPVNVLLVTREPPAAVFAAIGWAPDVLSIPGTLHLRLFEDLLENGTPPVSDLYLDGRREDMAFQDLTGSVARRQHVRLWLLGTLNGSAVYAGSASYDEGLSIGIRYHFPVPLHRTSPDVDASRDGLLAAFRNRTSVAASYLALASEVPRATSEEAREEQPYFTDGRVLMLET